MTVKQPSGARTLHSGDVGEDVRAVQRALNARAAPRDYPPIPVDGVVGPSTVWAYLALGHAVGFLPETLREGITPDAQALLADPSRRVRAQLERERQRAPGLASRSIAFDGTPVFWGLAKPLQRAREAGWNGVLNSADRRSGFAERYGKASQPRLFSCYGSRLRTGRCPSSCPSCNPANRPGRSTHELRSDGVAYRGPVGRQLAWWQLGLDLSDVDELLRVLARLGYRARRPYRSGAEAQHVNFSASPGPVITYDARLPPADATPPSPRPVPAPPPAPSPVPPKPVPVTINGPDISVYQGRINWPELRAGGHEFAIVRATVGAAPSDTDEFFGPGRLQAMADADIVRGFYHVGYPSGGDALTEARHAVRTVRGAGGLVAGDLPLCLDLEQTRLSPRATFRWASDFCSEVRRLTGRGCILYTYPAFWRTRVGDPSEPPEQGGVLWIANYRVPFPTVPRAWRGRGWTFWQYTDRGRAPGISGAVDLNRFHGTRAAFDALRLQPDAASSA